MAKGSFDLPSQLDESRQRSGKVRTLVAKAILPDDPSRKHAQIDPVEEIMSLADTRELEVVGSVTQRRVNPHSRTYLGKGKIQELKEMIAAKNAELVVVDDSLSPIQGKSLEDALGVAILDRTELILEIFAAHARTHQAKLQIELAQLRYSQSRLKRMWTHLSRYEGGIGMRGPGETQLETDRRIIKKKIQNLQEKLEGFEQQMTTQHQGRANTFQVTIVGYTNAGKSSLMRRLTGADVLVEDRLFSTLDTCTRRWELPVSREVILSDTVGFISNLPHTLIASFHATLRQAQDADLLLHVVDGSTSHAEIDLASVEETLRAIDCTDRPRFLLFNKIDLLPEDRKIDLQYLLDRHPEAIAISVKDGTGIEALIECVTSIISSDEKVIEYRFPQARGDLLARLREVSTILEENYTDSEIVAKVRMVPADKERFDGYLAQQLARTAR